MNATAPSPVRGVAFFPSQRDKDVLVGLHHGAESAATFQEIDFAVRVTTAVRGLERHCRIASPPSLTHG
jgi:hypothetical protein